MKNILVVNLKYLEKGHLIKTQNPRELYNLFLTKFELKYNTINSFEEVLGELKNNLSLVLDINIQLGKPLRSMLGGATKSVEEAYDVTGKPAFLDYKYDGLRVQIHNNKGEVHLFSRNLENITKQFPEVVEFVKDNFSDVSFVCDSECVGFDFEKQVFLPFQMLSRRILTKKIDEVSHIHVVVKLFDIMFLNGETLLEKGYVERRELLEELLVNRPLKQKLHFKVEKIKNLG
jgi:DNA ligase-1